MTRVQISHWGGEESLVGRGEEVWMPGLRQQSDDPTLFPRLISVYITPSTLLDHFSIM